MQPQRSRIEGVHGLLARSIPVGSELEPIVSSEQRLFTPRTDGAMVMLDLGPCAGDASSMHGGPSKLA